MKITTFNPMIISSKANDIMAVFEELGFEKRHNKVDADEEIGFSSTRMKDANGFHVDVAQVDMVPRDMTSIRMNVDNFEEAYAILVAHGFMNPRTNETITPSSKSAYMVSPSGFSINLVKHIKK